MTAQEPDLGRAQTDGLHVPMVPHDHDPLANLVGFVREDHQASDDIFNRRSGRQG